WIHPLLPSGIQARYHAPLSSPAIVYLCHPFSPYSPIYISQNITVFGYPHEEWFTRSDIWLDLIHHDDREQVLRITKEAMKEGHDTELEYRMVAKDGSIHWLHVNGCFISDSQGNKTGWQGVM